MRVKKDKKPKKTCHTAEISTLVEKKHAFFHNLIQQTIIHVESGKIFDILSVSDMNRCVKMLKVIHESLDSMYKKLNESVTETILKNLQEINNEMSCVVRIFGTHNLDDLMHVCVGTSSALARTTDPLMNLLKKYFHPTGYSVVSNKNAKKQTICEDIVSTQMKYHMKVYGLKLTVYDEISNKTIQITGFVDDVMVYMLTDDYVVHMKESILRNLPDEDDFKSVTFDKFLESLTLKDYLVNDNKGIYAKYMGYVNEMNIIHQQEMSFVVKKFIQEDMFIKRIVVPNLLNRFIFKVRFKQVEESLGFI